MQVSDITPFCWDVGIEIDASNASLSFFDAFDNVSAAVLLKGAKNGAIGGVSAASTTTSGPCILLKKANNNSLFGIEVGGCTDGVDLMHSSRNTLVGLDVSATGDGTFLDPGSNNNVLTENDVGGFFDEGEENGANGIEIGEGSKRNKVVVNASLTNDGNDLLDDNPDCDKNTWLDNCFETASPACAAGLAPLC